MNPKIYVVPKKNLFNSRSEMRRLNAMDIECLLLVEKTEYDSLKEKYEKLLKSSKRPS